jgi:3-oxoadipate enol-lactonase
MFTAGRMAIPCLFHDPCVDLNFYEEGSGEVLILIHGLGENALSWRFQIEAFRQDFRVIAPDLRGHGDSGHRDDEEITIRRLADDLIALARNLGIAKAHFCGLSLGALVALEIFNRYPRWVSSLILADSQVFFPAPSPLADRLRLLDRLGMMGWAGLAAPMYLRPGASEAERAEVGKMFANNRPEPYRQAVVATFSADYRWLLPLIDAPTLILLGEEDQVVPMGVARYAHRHIPNSTLKIIPGAGHLTNLENPAAFNVEVKAHLMCCRISI